MSLSETATILSDAAQTCCNPGTHHPGRVQAFQGGLAICSGCMLQVPGCILLDGFEVLEPRDQFASAVPWGVPGEVRLTDRRSLVPLAFHPAAPPHLADSAYPGCPQRHGTAFMFG